MKEGRGLRPLPWRRGQEVIVVAIVTSKLRIHERRRLFAINTVSDAYSRCPACSRLREFHGDFTEIGRGHPARLAAGYVVPTRTPAEDKQIAAD